MAAKKFTFKTVKPTGKYRGFYNNQYLIKLNGNTVGKIDPEDYSIRLMVYKTDKITDSNPNCVWTWIKLGHKDSTLEGAQTWLNIVFTIIQEKYKLYELN